MVRVGFAPKKRRKHRKIHVSSVDLCYHSNTIENVRCKKNKLLVTCISFLGLPVIAALIVPNVLLYLILPTIFQVPIINQTNITQLNISVNHCGGVSSYKQWQNYVIGSDTIFMSVITSNCSFSKSPVYYASIDGNNLHTDFSGYNSIYFATTVGFSIYLRNIQGYSVEQMWNYSQIEKWNVSWVGVY